LNKWGNQIKQH